MTARKEQAYKTLLRMAKVKEVRADVALAQASAAEMEQRRCVGKVLAAREAAAMASQACTSEGEHLDMSRYEMLALLNIALADKHEVESQRLDDASRMRRERASENVRAKRFRERVAEKRDDAGSALMREKQAKTQEDLVELWIGRREGES